MPGLIRPPVDDSADASGLERTPDGVLTIHPTPRRLPRGGSLAALPLAVAGAIRLLLLGWVGVAILVSVICLGLALAFFIGRHRVSHSYGRLTASNLTVKPWYRGPRTVPREAVARVVLVTAKMPLNDPDQPLMLFLDRDGRSLLTLNCLGIAPSDASVFAHALGVPVSSPAEDMTPKQLRSEYPGSIAAFYAHEVAWGVVLGLAICVLVIAGVVGWAALTGKFGPPKPVALGVTQSEYSQSGRSGQRIDDVTVLRVDNPARTSIPATAAEPGTHFVGVLVRVKNTGGPFIGAPDGAVSLRTSQGHVYWMDGISDPAGAKLNTDTEVDSGQTETAYVLIRVPDGSVVTRVKFESNGDDTDAPTWVVPRQPAPPAPPAAQLGQPLSLGDEQVTVLAVDDPVQGRPSTTSLPPGDHLVGVEVQITNTSSSAGDPPFEQLTVVDSAGRTNDVADLSASSGVPLNLVKAGQTVTTTVYFDVPQGARVVVVQTAWYPASLNGGAATVGWAVPPP